jgi:hypothetical protein
LFASAFLSLLYLTWFSKDQFNILCCQLSITLFSVILTFF